MYFDLQKLKILNSILHRNHFNDIRKGEIKIGIQENQIYMS